MAHKRSDVRKFSAVTFPDELKRDVLNYMRCLAAFADLDDAALWNRFCHGIAFKKKGAYRILYMVLATRLGHFDNLFG